MFFRGISTLPRSSWEILPGQLSSQIRSKKCKYLRKNITLTWINHDVVYFTSSCMQGLFYELPQTSSIFDLVKDGNSLKKNSIMVKVSGDPPDLFSQTCHSLIPHRWNPIHPLWGCPSNKQFWKNHPNFLFFTGKSTKYVDNHIFVSFLNWLYLLDTVDIQDEILVPCWVQCLWLVAGVAPGGADSSCWKENKKILKQEQHKFNIIRFQRHILNVGLC